MIQINLIVCAIAVNVLYSLALSLTLKFTNFLLKQHIALSGIDYFEKNKQNLSSQSSRDCYFRK